MVAVEKSQNIVADDPQPYTQLIDRPADNTVTRCKQKNQKKQKAGSQGHHARRTGVLETEPAWNGNGAHMSQHGRKHGKEDTDRQHASHPVGNQMRRGSGDDEHGDDQNAAHAFECCDGGRCHEGHQAVVHEIGVDPHGGGQGRIKGGNFQFLEKSDDEDQIDNQHDPAGDGSLGDVITEEQDRVQRGQFNGPVKHATWIQIHVIGCLTDENQTDGEQGGEDHSHGCAAVEATDTVNALD